MIFLTFIFVIDRIVKGMPTVSRKPPQHQKWKSGTQAGGGAVIPCSWLLEVDKTTAPQAVANILMTLPKLEGEEDIEVVVSIRKLLSLTRIPCLYLMAYELI